MINKLDTLLNIGVKIEHIEKMKNVYPEPMPDDNLYDYEKHEETRLVNFDLVTGGHRIDSNKSWYENFMNADKDLGQGRITKNLEIILKYEDKIADYENFLKEDFSFEPIWLTFYDNLNEYFTYNGGNHRLIIAKMMGVKEICARVTTYHYKGFEVEQRKKRYTSNIENVINGLESLGLTCKLEGSSDLDLDVLYDGNYIVNLPLPYDFTEDQEPLAEVMTLTLLLKEYLPNRTGNRFFGWISDKVHERGLFTRGLSDETLELYHRVMERLVEEGYFTANKSKG